MSPSRLIPGSRIHTISKPTDDCDLHWLTLPPLLLQSELESRVVDDAPFGEWLTSAGRIGRRTGSRRFATEAQAAAADVPKSLIYQSYATGNGLHTAVASACGTCLIIATQVRLR